MVNKRPCLLACKQLEKCRYMSEDLLVEIFKRWPVKPLGRMRCVCKSWNSVISSPTFIAHHLHQSSSIPSTQKSYLALSKCGKINLYAFYHHADQGAPSFEHSTKWFDRLPFQHFPFQTRHHSPPNHHLIYIGLIHGVVCLNSDPSSSTIILWNPTIRKYVEITDKPFKVRDSNHYVHALGFGFHSRKDDFRLIRLHMPIQLFQPGRRPKRQRLGYQVFSPQDGAWKKAVASTRIQPGNIISEASFFMNGTVHWIVSTYKVRKGNERRNTEYYRLLMFDCECEELTEMVLPRAFNRRRYKGESFEATLLKCRGRLAVLMMSSTFELWVMEEYGVSSTWKKVPWGELGIWGFTSEESMFLMDAKTQAVSYTSKKHGNDDGKVYYEIGGRTCEYILI